MQISQTQYEAGIGWKRPLPAELDGGRTLVLVFGAPALLDSPEPLQDVAAAFPTSVVLGCSTAGEITDEGVGDNGLSVVITRFERTDLRLTSAPLTAAGDSHDAGVRLAAGLAPEGLRTVLVLSSGVNVNGAALVRGLTAGLPETVSVSGGLAGDAARFVRTWVLLAGRPTEGYATAVGLYGDALRVGHGCDSGWSDFGPERKITAALDNVLSELDGQPALALYKNYLGDLAGELPGAALRFPLSMRQADDPEGLRTVVRTILGVDETTQTMTFAGDMPAGAIVRLMRTNTDQLVSSAAGSATRARQELAADNGPVLALSVSCIGRRLIMGERTEEELEAVAEMLPPGSAHTGFYSYGEISPVHGFTCAQLHNQTMTVTMLAEA